MKKLLQNLLMFQTLFTSNFGAPKMVAVPIILIEFAEGIGKTIKTNWKKGLIISSLPLLINNNVGAGTLNTRVVSPITKPYCKTQHISGAREPLEGYDGNGIDVLFNDMQFPPTIDIYSKVDFDPYRLKIDARPPESTSTFNLEISGRGLTAPENAVLEPKFSYYLGDNFWWKNIIGELSQRVDDGAGGYKYALIGNYDIKNMVSSVRTIPISIENGVTIGTAFFPSHKLDYKFFNHADFNRDRRIDGLDFAIFSENYGGNNETDPNTFGDYVGSDVNNYNAYADINRSGGVDFDDLDIFKTYFKFPVDFNSDGRVGLDDFAYFAPYWGATDVNSVADISGPNGIPDKNVDYWDLGAFSDDYLRDINEPNTWSRVR